MYSLRAFFACYIFNRLMDTGAPLLSAAADKGWGFDFLIWWYTCK